MNDVVLLVFEGENTERQVFSNLEKWFFPSSNSKLLIKSTFKGEIFQLSEKIKGDNGLDIVEIIKERDSRGIEDLKRDTVSAIHLFFDYDPHSHPDITNLEYNEMIIQLLDTFDNEFDQGKLWISYPMIEAIKHCTENPNDCFYDAFLDISQISNYKKFVDEKSQFKDIRKFDEDTWHYITLVNIQRVYCLVHSSYDTVSEYKKIKHWFEENAVITKNIQEKQFDKFIFPKNQIVALSPFPLFLINYFGEKYFESCKDTMIIKNCSFCCYCS
jgi:hypothetical protein